MAKKWYVVHTYSGYEDKVKASIEEKVKAYHLTDKIARIIIPTEKVIELRNKKKYEVGRKFYPGYILVEMDLDDETWHLIKNTPRVTGFIGKTKPVALTDDEVELIINQMQEGPAPTKSRFEKGDSVKIIEGPFTNWVGYVDEVDADHSRLKVMVTIFGRQTPVELSFYQVEKT
ncbi:MAG: transcription termination/antitermination protein NusG [Thermodesulfovibrionales bacterium]|nr:transcription termination/antitermination protein NusG [Thermodesulfovibrionales bacterium]